MPDRAGNEFFNRLPLIIFTMPHADHQQQADDTAVRCAVVTVSDTRTEDTDTSGSFIRTALTDAGFTVDHYTVVPDEPTHIDALLDELAGAVDAILMNGGTGVSARDQTVDVVETRIDKPLPGFGELFRMLSYEEIGAGAMLSRATAGVVRNTLVFAMPGSTNAVKLAMTKLILPELKHLVWEIVRQQPTDAASS
jgi:molybdenum cofactor biosynthesis protein B